MKKNTTILLFLLFRGIGRRAARIFGAELIITLQPRLSTKAQPMAGLCQMAWWDNTTRRLALPHTEEDRPETFDTRTERDRTTAALLYSPGHSRR